MKFRYVKIPLQERSDYFGSSILKPVIPVTLSVHGGKSTMYAALIDSGADFSIFHAEVAEYLGIDVRSGRKEMFGSIQERGGSESFLHPITLNIGGWDYKTTVGFSYDIAQWGYGVLGQRGFFDVFVVTFDLLKEEIKLKERK
jgi:predicted aspartyl protease